MVNVPERKHKNKVESTSLKSNGSSFGVFINSADDKSLSSVLDKLGRLNQENKDLIPHLISLLTHKTPSVRSRAIHNLGKYCDIELFPVLTEHLQKEVNTEVRREAVSAIGRMRDTNTIDFLTSMLVDSDPKVVMQAIRGLLVFKKNDAVMKSLEPLKDHPNEQIQRILTPIFDSSVNKIKAKPKSVLPKSFLVNTVIHADVLTALDEIPDEEIHLTFTSPPYYNARDYSIYSSYDQYLQFLRKVFEKIHRTTREGRFLIINTSPVILPRFSRAHASRRYPIPFDLHSFMDEIGWEYIDDIVWLKPEASVKNRNGGFQQHRKPLGYKPNNVTEMLMVYRKKTDRLLDWNIRQYDEKTVKESLVEDEFETTNVWRIDPKNNKVHSAVFPIELCKKVISYYSFKGDLVFDPFAGSGTLGQAALLTGRKFLLTELNEAYFELMKNTFSVDSPLLEVTEKDVLRFLDLKQFVDLRNSNQAESEN